LLTRRTVSIDTERIRGLDLRDTPLRRPLGLAAVTAIVSGVGRAGGRSTLAPVARTGEVNALLRSVDPLAPDPATPLVAHPKPARTRRFVRALAVPVIAIVIAITVAFVPGWWWALALALLLTAVMAVVALDRYRQLGHRYDGRRLALREGSLLRRWTELDPSEIVSYELRRTPTQRRAGLATLILHLGQGAGTRRVPDAGAAQLRELLGELEPQLLAPLAANRHGGGAR
jgi:putative membrane protein